MSPDNPYTEQSTERSPPKSATNVGPLVPRLRAWLLIAVVAGAFFALRLYVADGAFKTIVLFLGSMFVGIILWSWFAFFSGYSRGFRFAVTLAIVVAVAAVGNFVKVQKFDGSLIPTLILRSTPLPDQTLDEELLAGGEKIAADLSITGPSDFSQFLGNHRDSRLTGVNLARDWKAMPPKEIWKREVGAAWSGFASVNGFACTLEQRGPKELVTCYTVENGKPCWSHAINARHTSDLGYVGPRSTPTIHEGNVYAYGATGVMRCLQGSDGSEIWTRDLVADAGMSQRDAEAAVAWGRSSSPLIHQDLVIVPVGGKKGAKMSGLVALDKHTGETRWESGEFQASYASPAFATLGGVDQILSVNEASLSGHDPQTGKPLWVHEWPGNSAANANVSQPLPLDDSRVFLSKGYGQGSELIRVEQEGDEWFTDVEWSNARALRTKFSNVAIRDGKAYGLDEQTLQCLDVEKNKILWKGNRYGYGQILMVDDLLLVLAENGELALVEASPDAFRELGRVPVLEGQTWNTLCLVGKRLLVRNSEQAACYELP